MRAGSGRRRSRGRSRRPRSGTARSVQSRANGATRRGGSVSSRQTTRPAGADDARHLGEAAREVGQVADAEADGGGVELAVANGSAERVAAHPLHLRALGAGGVEHRLREVEADDAAAGRDGVEERDGQVACAAADVERRSPGASAGAAHGPGAPARRPCRRSSPGSCGRTPARCGRTSPAPGRAGASSPIPSARRGSPRLRRPRGPGSRRSRPCRRWIRAGGRSRASPGRPRRPPA